MKSWRCLLLLLAGLASATTVSAASQLVHSLSFRVVVDGQVVMAPVMQVHDARPATFSLETADGQARHSVQVTMTQDGDLDGRTGPLLEAVIWDGKPDTGRLLQEFSLLIDPTNIGQPGTVMIEDRDGQRTGIEVVSWALVEPASAD